MDSQSRNSIQTLQELHDLIARRGIKDSVFTHLFRDNRYVLQLYQALFPEDQSVTIDDIKTITLEYDLVNEYYNDLGFLVGDQLIVLVEAQSEWSDNIIVRIFLYLAQTWKNYIDSHDEIDLHSTKKVKLPKPEFFVIYTGDKKNVKDVVTYADDFLGGKESNIDIRVKVIRNGKDGDIINQYIRFTKVFTEQVKLHGRTRKAVEETIRICKDQNILKEYLQSREQEVITIMVALYDFENTLDKKIRLERHAAKEEGAMESARNMYHDGVKIEKIAQYLGCAVDTVKQWLGLQPA